LLYILIQAIREDDIKKFVATAIPSGQSPLTQLKDLRVDLCHTFIVATSLHAGGAVRMLSFGTRDDDPFPACKWQAARATAATPTYFLPIEIDDVLMVMVAPVGITPRKKPFQKRIIYGPIAPLEFLSALAQGSKNLSS